MTLFAGLRFHVSHRQVVGGLLIAYSSPTEPAPKKRGIAPLQWHAPYWVEYFFSALKGAPSVRTDRNVIRLS